MYSGHGPVMNPDAFRGYGPPTAQQPASFVGYVVVPVDYFELLIRERDAWKDEVWRAQQAAKDMEYQLREAQRVSNGVELAEPPVE